MEQEEMSYYDKQMAKRTAFAGYTVAMFLRFAMPIIAISLAWKHAGWEIGVLLLITWFVLAASFALARAAAKAEHHINVFNNEARSRHTQGN